MSNNEKNYNNQPDNEGWNFAIYHHDNFLNSHIDLDLPLLQNLESQLERGSSLMSMPDNVPTSVELYFRRFRNTRCSCDEEDLFAVIRAIWSTDCPLTFDEKLETILKIATWDDWEFDVDGFVLPHFVGCQYAIVQTSRQPNTHAFLIEHIQQMNYAAKVQTINCLAGVKESVDVIEDILAHSFHISKEWEIMSACKESLWLTYKFFYPEKIKNLLSLEVADRADPKTKPNWKRANSIEFITLDEEETEN